MSKAFARAFPGGKEALAAAIHQRLSDTKQHSAQITQAGYSRFDALGNVVQCPSSLLLALGTGDDEKRICAPAGLTSQHRGKGCTVISVGSNNQWKFEQAVAQRFPHCAIHTLDCTVDGKPPRELSAHVTYHPVCLSDRDHVQPDGRRYLSWASFVESIGLQGPPTALKMDIEGFEWSVLRSMVASRAPLPFSLSVELHVWTEVREVEWYGTWRSANFVKQWMDGMLLEGGYMLVDRHDNPMCSYCSEVVLARLAAPSSAAPRRPYRRLQPSTLPREHPVGGGVGGGVGGRVGVLRNGDSRGLRALGRASRLDELSTWREGMSHTQSPAESHVDGQVGGQAGGQVGGQAEGQAGGQVEGQVDGQVGGQVGGQLGGPTAWPERCVPCATPAAAPTVHIVTTHFREPVSWIVPVLSDLPRAHVFIYECGEVALPSALRQHPRVVVRDKSGELAQRDPFYSFFDHVARSYEQLAEYTLFMHGHDTHYHRNTPAHRVALQAYELITTRQVEYVNLGDAVHSTWTGCEPLGAPGAGLGAEAPTTGSSLTQGPRPNGIRIGSDESFKPDAALCTAAPPCASMPILVAQSWPTLSAALGIPGLPPPSRIWEINGNEALVARCRLRSRPVRYWESLRDLTLQHHSALAFGLEGSFHHIMGEPWVRPFISKHRRWLNFVACSPNATDTLWPGELPPGAQPSSAPPKDFTKRWLRFTELSLRLHLANGGCR